MWFFFEMSVKISCYSLRCCIILCQVYLKKQLNSSRDLLQYVQFLSYTGWNHWSLWMRHHVGVGNAGTSVPDWNWSLHTCSSHQCLWWHCFLVSCSFQLWTFSRRINNLRNTCMAFDLLLLSKPFVSLCFLYLFYWDKKYIWKYLPYSLYCENWGFF